MSEILNNKPVESQPLKASDSKPKAKPEVVAGGPDFKDATKQVANVANAAIDGKNFIVTGGNIDAPGTPIKIIPTTADAIGIKIGKENKFHSPQHNFENDWKAYLAYERSTMA